jgi:hypothetical protein
VGSRAQGGAVASGALDRSTGSTHGAAYAGAKQVATAVTTATAAGEYTSGRIRGKRGRLTTGRTDDGLGASAAVGERGRCVRRALRHGPTRAADHASADWLAATAATATAVAATVAVTADVGRRGGGGGGSRARVRGSGSAPVWAPGGVAWAGALANGTAGDQWAARRLVDRELAGHSGRGDSDGNGASSSAAAASTTAAATATTAAATATTAAATAAASATATATTTTSVLAALHTPAAGGAGDLLDAGVAMDERGFRACEAAYKGTSRAAAVFATTIATG